MRLIAVLEASLIERGEDQSAHEARQLWLALEGFTGGCEPERTDAMLMGIWRAYGAPERRFHTAAHITRMLALLGERSCRGDLGPADLRLLLPAILYHDYVYATDLPVASLNERASAALAYQEVLGLGYDAAAAFRVFGLVMATMHGSPVTCPGSPDERLADLMASLDLSDLAGEWREFAALGALAREEFSSLDDTGWEANQRAFFSMLLARERIYRDPPLAELLEESARRNLTDWLAGRR